MTEIFHFMKVLQLPRGSTIVEHLPHCRKAQGSYPATFLPQGDKKWQKNVLCCNNKLVCLRPANSRPGFIIYGEG